MATSRPPVGELPRVNTVDPARDPLSRRTRFFVGRFAVCSHGYIGRITGRAWVTYGDGFSNWAWVGVSMHGKPWSSTRPRFLQPADEAVLRQAFGERTMTAVGRGVPEMDWKKIAGQQLAAAAAGGPAVRRTRAVRTPATRTTAGAARKAARKTSVSAKRGGTGSKARTTAVKGRRPATTGAR